MSTAAEKSRRLFEAAERLVVAKHRLAEATHMHRLMQALKAKQAEITKTKTPEPTNP